MVAARPEARFWAKVVRSGDCWIWTASTSDGYGRFTLRHGHDVFAHRYSYELAKGPIPEGLTIDHLCRRRACVNPDHLEAVRNTTNVLRGEGITAAHARQTHCIHGHAFTPENTRLRADGHRECKECSRLRSRNRYRGRKR